MSCPPTRSNGTAVCTTVFPGASGSGAPDEWRVDNTESSVYLATFTSAEPFPAPTVMAAASSASSSPALGSSPSEAGRLSLGPRAKVGVVLGVCLGICACALLGVAVLLRYRRRKERARGGGESTGVGLVGGDGGDKIVVGRDVGGVGGEISELSGGEAGGRNELEGEGQVGREELA